MYFYGPRAKEIEKNVFGHACMQKHGFRFVKIGLLRGETR